MSSKNVQKTLIVFKPDAVQRGIVGEILTRFERVGLKMVGTKMIAPDREHYFKHYEEIGKVQTRHGEQVLNVTLDSMSKGPVVAIVLEGVEAIALVRKLVGSTEPKTAAPGTIRGDYSHMSYGYADEVAKGIPNLIHASADEKEAEEEISHWFADSELYEYELPNEKFTR